MSEAEIVTNGSGWHEQLGDLAELDVGFAASAPNRSAAVAGLGEHMATAGPAFDRPGVTVRHRRFSVNDEWDGNRVAGCRAEEHIALVIDDIAVLEALMTALVAVEPAHLNGPRWALVDPDSARREAQRRAVADARDRAEGYAAALGGRLGALRRLSEAPGSDDYGALSATYARESGAQDVANLGLDPEPVRVAVRCTTTWTVHGLPIGG